MISTTTSPTGVMFSGGLDSGILIAHQVEAGCPVQPIYVRSGLRWEAAEMEAAQDFLWTHRATNLADLVVLDVPVSDLYGNHWSRSTNSEVPGAESADEEVYLPGRNALLMVKAGIWCRLNQVPRLALAVLGSSPFADASPEFFDALQSALNCGLEPELIIDRPFAGADKATVMELGRHCALGKTFSCLSPRGHLHCGSCNKCAERRAAFLAATRWDPTNYFHEPVASTPLI